MRARPVKPTKGSGDAAGMDTPAMKRWQSWGPLLALLLVLLLWSGLSYLRSAGDSLTYSAFLTKADAGQVKTIIIESSGSASGTLTSGNAYSTNIPVELAGPEFLAQLHGDKVTVSSTSSSSGGLGSWILGLLPLLLIGFLLFSMARRGKGLISGVMGTGRSKAKVFDAENPTSTFADVAGYEGIKAEVAEVVDFLKRPERYRRAGAVAPRGVLMLGPPGTGKTLIARAVAGEAGVPFFSVSGSSFVEMFVGVGAARVRDLFAEARKRAPSIIFVDEIDAIGVRRSGSGAPVSNDEREQTLNQLLSEMDGFDPTVGVVVLAATNRPEVLDLALLRPGRFDRQVTIPLPTQSERRAILVVHCKDKQLAHDVDLDVVARSTPGFSGADLANLANEAAIAAVRADREITTAEDFSEARDRILLGRRDGSNVLLAEEKHAVAVHESGHALVAALLPHADPVAKVTILPAGQTLGVTEQLPLSERHLHSESRLRDILTVRLAGRAAEMVELGEASTGASDDLDKATQLAISMVRELVMSPQLGPVGYPLGGSVFLGGGGAELSSRPFADGTQELIDAEVSRLVREAEIRALALLRDHRSELQALVRRLLVCETLDGSEVYALLEQLVPVAP